MKNGIIILGLGVSLFLGGCNTIQHTDKHSDSPVKEIDIKEVNKSIFDDVYTVNNIELHFKAIESDKFIYVTIGEQQDKTTNLIMINYDAYNTSDKQAKINPNKFNLKISDNTYKPITDSIATVTNDRVNLLDKYKPHEVREGYLVFSISESKLVYDHMKLEIELDNGDKIDYKIKKDFVKKLEG